MTPDTQKNIQFSENPQTHTHRGQIKSYSVCFKISL